MAFLSLMLLFFPSVDFAGWKQWLESRVAVERHDLFSCWMQYSVSLDCSAMLTSNIYILYGYYIKAYDTSTKQHSRCKKDIKVETN